MKKRIKDMTEPEISTVMHALADKIIETAASLKVEKPRFVLLMFNDPTVSQYISNCERGDVITALFETAYRMHNREDVRRG